MSKEEPDENKGAGQENWFVIMHRNGPTWTGEPGPFEKNRWAEYQKGFGSFANYGNFWWGLENLHQRTSTGKWNVMFTFRMHRNGPYEGGSAVIKFHGFRVASNKDKYRLSIGKNYQYEGHPKLEKYIQKIQGINNKMFSTTDSNNDENGWLGLANWGNGGFWYNGIHLNPLTGHRYTDSLMAISPA